MSELSCFRLTDCNLRLWAEIGVFLTSIEMDTIFKESLRGYLVHRDSEALQRAERAYQLT